MPRHDVTVHAPQSDTDVYTVPEFAFAHRISPAFVYKLWAQGRGPEYIKVGARRLITKEAAARWRAQQEQAPAA